MLYFAWSSEAYIVTFIHLEMLILGIGLLLMVGTLVYSFCHFDTSS